MPFWHRPFPNYRQREMVRHIFLALKVLKARGFAAKLSGLANLSLNMSSAASLTGSMTKRPIKAPLDLRA